MFANIIIPNPNKLDKLKEAIKSGGHGQLQILADFDRTLTSFAVDGKKAPTLIAILRDQKHLTPDYPDKAQALADEYYPIEIDPLIPLEEKKEAMVQWWQKHFELLIKSNLTKKDVETAMKFSGVKLREGVEDFIKKLEQDNIPLVIMSANGLGAESIEFFLNEINQLKDNIHIISNALIWDEEGRAIGMREPIVHPFNKDETLLQDYPDFEKIKEKKNIILLGDTLGDADMARGFDYDKLIKIGFLNDNVKENLDSFEQSYDIIILNDSSFEYINLLLEELIE